MRALVLSDSHGDKSALKLIASRFSAVDYFFHLGDYVGDAHALSAQVPQSKVVCVKGNCDISAAEPEFEELVLQGNRVILTHGHALHAKYSYDRLLYYAAERDAAAILFGHTHLAHTEYVNGIWLVNPGSASRKGNNLPSVALLVITPSGVVPKVIKL